MGLVDRLRRIRWAEILDPPTLYSGTVTSVGLTMPSEFSVSGSPVTTTGTLAVTAASQSANRVYASPDGSAGAMSARALVAADIPSLAASKITSGTIDTARLGSGTANSKTYLRGDQTWADPSYSLHVCTTTVHNPGDGLTYYFGAVGFAAVTTADTRRVYIPRAGTIVAASVVSDTTAGTVGTNENISIYIRLNNTTSTLIATVGAATKYREFRNTSLSITVAAGDYIEIEVVCPTWATNPTSVGYNGHIIIA